MHPRNRHQGQYDFRLLTLCCPELASFILTTPRDEPSIDFADPLALKTLNRALLKHYYGVLKWDIPPNYLCPPIPGRADYVHYLADLLAACNDGVIPRGKSISVLDIGVGANCIYPVIGHCEYGWSFIGSDCDPVALKAAKKTAATNQVLANAIHFRQQVSPKNILEGVVERQDAFDLTLCNPPFHSSLLEAQKGSQRKWNNLGVEPEPKKTLSLLPVLNFGGKSSELWYPGGESAFVGKMIQESARFSKNVFWYSALISKATNLPAIYAAIKKARVAEHRIIEMAQGQKKSRVIAWTFLDKKLQNEWRRDRWCQHGSG